MKLSALPSEPHVTASWLMNDIARICRQLIDKQMRAFELTRAQWYLLNYLYLYDGLSQQELADLVDLGKSNVSKHVQVLETKGWVTRGPHEVDRRSFRVFLSVEMKPTIQKLNAVAAACTKNLLARFTDKEIAQFVNMLRMIDLQLESELMESQSISGIEKLSQEINDELKKIKNGTRRRKKSFV